MHLEILVEDESGSILIKELMRKILEPYREHHTYRVIEYKGAGRIPKDLKGNIDPQKRILLDRLPKLLIGYGKAWQSYPHHIIVVVDQDSRDCIQFKDELVKIANQCKPKPNVFFRIAIEEIEAWLMGDENAIIEAYPRARKDVLRNYRQDSVCGTWEKLADAIHTGGSAELIKLGYPVTGRKKAEWAGRIGPNMDVNRNNSKSFQVFRDGIISLLESTHM
ncbi:DUF4276 family protein [Candidatus Micrarchaeota archaeon]|nr:DUF4276 family protein [Candidatus Micrarchaeota archaeon]